jgi:hypothetical protein
MVDGLFVVPDFICCESHAGKRHKKTTRHPMLTKTDLDIDKRGLVFISIPFGRALKNMLFDPGFLEFYWE